MLLLANLITRINMKKLLSIIIFGLMFSCNAFAENDYETPKYSLVSIQVLEEVCRNDWCVNTIKKWFVFKKLII